MRTAGFGESAWMPTSGVLPMRSRIDSYRATGGARLSPGDGGEDGDDVAVGHLGLELVEVPDVVVVAVHVDELVDAARLVDQLVGKTRVASSQIGEHVAHGGAGGGHRRGPVGMRPQEGGETNLDRHGTSVQVRPDGSGFSLSGRARPDTRRPRRRGSGTRAAPGLRPASSRSRRPTPDTTWPARCPSGTGTRRCACGCANNPRGLHYGPPPRATPP